MSKLNVNTATVKELAALQGIGPSLARRIVEYRETVGPFRTIYEIAAVKGVSEALITRIRHLITVDPGSPGSNTGNFILSVRMKSDGVDPQQYEDHSISVKYVRIETISDPEGNVTYLSIPEESVKKVDDDAKAVFELPKKDDLEGEVLISALAPDGELLKDKTFTAADLPEEVSINVKPRDYFAVEPNEDPNFGKSARLRGRVIEALDRQEIEFTQVVIWGATKDEPQEQDFRALIVADTDDKGYFSGPLPRGVFTAAYGVVAVGDGVTVPIHLLDDQTFPENVILVVNLDDVPLPAPEEEDDCECHKKPPAVPRDPDSADLSRADGTYSQDLGKGGCIDFTRPDRTLDEFTYSYVVRTTEPSIKGMTLEEPDKISANLLLNLLPAQFTTAAFAEKMKRQRLPAL
ncbi:MAG: helix-hairpin-helix domain-containing protein [Calditrichia bacterium]